jgi:hypothetical protein
VICLYYSLSSIHKYVAYLHNIYTNIILNIITLYVSLESPYKPLHNAQTRDKIKDTLNNLEARTVRELRDILRNLGVPAGGDKTNLIKRIKMAQSNEARMRILDNNTKVELTSKIQPSSKEEIPSSNKNGGVEIFTNLTTPMAGQGVNKYTWNRKERLAISLITSLLEMSENKLVRNSRSWNYHSGHVFMSYPLKHS